MESNWVIEEARPEHIPAMIEFWQEIDGVGLGRSDEPWALEIMLTNNPGSCLIAWQGETMVGTILGGFDGRRGMIYHLAVSPPWRRRKLGKVLLERCLKVMRQRGAVKVNLFVYRDNSGAITFYEGLGWVQREDIHAYSWDYPAGFEEN
jgi:ribosomal protein S18 acetylase RimI-like enzyme